jgi:hypothetical protein
LTPHAGNFAYPAHCGGFPVFEVGCACGGL